MCTLFIKSFLFSIKLIVLGLCAVAARAHVAFFAVPEGVKFDKNIQNIHSNHICQH